MFRIKPIVVLATLVVGLGVAALSHAASPTAPAPHPVAMKHAAVKVMRIDLNMASKDELTKLPGIDDATADKIIAARPFKSKTDLKARHLLTPAEYAKVAGRVTVKASTATTTK
jgi:competence protein ComEA